MSTSASAGVGGKVHSRRIRRAGWTLIALFPPLVFVAAESMARLFDWRQGTGPEGAVPAWLDESILAKEGEWIRLLSESPGEVSDYYHTYLWDRHLFYRLRPGLDLTMTDITAPPARRERTAWTFHTNERGFNTPVVPWEKPEGTFRVVTMGDSSTFGWGVDPERTYPRLLESMLRRKYPAGRFEVINLGVCGYTSLQGLVLLKREAHIYRPDVITFSYGSNDFSPVPEPFDEIYERNLGWRGAVRAIAVKSRALLAWEALLRGAARGLSGEAGGAETVLNVGPDKARLNMMEMVYIAESKGAEPLFVTNCVRDHLGEPIHDAAAGTGTRLLDVERLFHESSEAMRGQGSPWPDADPRAEAIGLYGDRLVEQFPWIAVYLTDHCHPNVHGHRLIAEHLLPMVENTGAFAGYLASLPRPGAS